MDLFFDIPIDTHTKRTFAGKDQHKRHSRGVACNDNDDIGRADLSRCRRHSRKTQSVIENNKMVETIIQTVSAWFIFLPTRKLHVEQTLVEQTLTDISHRRSVCARVYSRIRPFPRLSGANRERTGQ